MRNPYMAGMILILFLCLFPQDIAFRMGDSEPQQANPSLSMEMSQTGAADIRNSFAAEANVSPELRQELSAIDENANGDDGGGSERGYLTLNASTARAYVATNQNADSNSQHFTRNAQEQSSAVSPMENWLYVMGFKPDTSTFRDALHFLNVIGLDDPDDLYALATSFEEIASSSRLGSECKPIVLMKLKNALWKETGEPEDMKEPITLADMIRFLHGSRPERKHGVSRDAEMPVHHRPQEPSIRCSANAVDERTRPRRKQSRPSDIY